MFDDLHFPYFASLHFQMISSTLLLPLTHLNYCFPYPIFKSKEIQTFSYTII
jgi:hypothetical protein